MRSRDFDIYFISKFFLAQNIVMVVFSQYPEVQDQVRAEVSSVTCGRRPCLHDRPRLDYTMAVLNEVMRFRVISPFAIPHHSTADVATKDGRVRIPAGTTVFTNIHQILHDPDLFPNPDEFRPERFLDSEGKLARIESNMVFGFGEF